MTQTERVLLDNALDALDRLFDSKSEAIDVCALMYATAQALTGSRFFGYFDETTQRLEAIVRSNLSRAEARERTLAATDELRKVIADALPSP